MDMEQNTDYLSLFIEELESIGLELGNELDRIEHEKENYNFYSEVKEQVEKSYSDFCSAYFVMDEEEKQDFNSRLLELFKDQEIVDNIVQEFTNLYFLSALGLLGKEEIAPQREIAEENLKTLVTKIERYLSDVNYDQLEANHERVAARLDRIVEMGSILEGEETTPLNDIDFLKETLESMELPEDTKKQILLRIVDFNLRIYDDHLAKKKDNVPFEEKIEELRDAMTVSPDVVEQIDELLSREEVVQRIVNSIYDEFTTVIDIRTPSVEEEQEISETIALAKEEMISSIESGSTKTPEEALSEFFQNYDETNRKKLEYIAKLTENTLGIKLSKEERDVLLQEAFSYAEEIKQEYGELDNSEKSLVREYMMSIFMNLESRDAYYQSKNNYSPAELEREAAYEIEVYKELLEAVPEEDEELQDKICTKIIEIMGCLQLNVTKEPEENIDEGNLFFVVDDEYSVLENNLGLGKNGKGMSSAYYGEVLSQLQAIEERSTRKVYSAQPVNPAYKTIRKEGVRYTTGTRTKVFYIPVGKKDSIIVGVSFLNGKDVNKDQERSVSYHQDQIEELKSRLIDPETYMDEKIKATTIRNRIMKRLKNKDLDDMLNDNSQEESVLKQK